MHLTLSQLLLCLLLVLHKVFGDQTPTKYVVNGQKRDDQQSQVKPNPTKVGTTLTILEGLIGGAGNHRYSSYPRRYSGVYPGNYPISYQGSYFGSHPGSYPWRYPSYDYPYSGGHMSTYPGSNRQYIFNRRSQPLVYYPTQISPLVLQTRPTPISSGIKDEFYLKYGKETINKVDYFADIADEKVDDKHYLLIDLPADHT